ncbi:MAG: hypothetical protein NT080_00355 [Spirochaetes bacterium]|nr:hypothetical protein [Spirochaetota bacterium]
MGRQKGRSLERHYGRRVRFKKLWSGDRGAFPQDSEAELPIDIVESLEAEGVVDIIEG